MRIRFAIIVLLSALGIALVYGYLFNLRYQADTALVTTRVEQGLSARERLFKSALIDIEKDAMFLAKLPSVQEYTNTQSLPQDEEIAQSLEAFFSTHLELYHHIRLIGSDGFERIRFNNVGGEVERTSREALQDKSQRYYFQRVKDLKPYQIYLSNMDLNMEEGRIQTPYTPVLRMAIPLFQNKQRFVGALILNIKGTRLLREFSQGSWTAPGQLYMVNRDGYFIAAPHDTVLWGSMLDRPDASVAGYFPDVWEEIRQKETAKLRTSKGLFISQSISSVELMRAPYSRWHTVHEAMLEKKQGPNVWTLLAFVPSGSCWRVREKICTEASG